MGLTVRVLEAAGGFSLYLAWRRFRRGSTPRLEVVRWGLLASAGNTAYLVGYVLALDHTLVSTVAPILGTSPLLVLLGAAWAFNAERVAIPFVENGNLLWFWRQHVAGGGQFFDQFLFAADCQH